MAIVTIARPLLIPFAIFGIFANVFLLGSICFDRRKKKRSLLSIMISAQACADFLLNVLYLWASIGVIQPGRPCQVQGFALQLIFQGTLLHWWVISVIRVRFVIESRETTRLHYFALFSLCWGISLVFTLFITFTSNFEIGPAGLYCAPKWDVSYVVITACIILFLFNLHLIYNYGSIYFYVKTNAREEHKSTTRMLIVVIIFFEISILPLSIYLLFRAFHVHNNNPINLAFSEIVAFSLVGMNTSTNPVLVSILSPWVRDKQIKFLNYIFCNCLTTRLGIIIDNQNIIPDDYDHHHRRSIQQQQNVNNHMSAIPPQRIPNPSLSSNNHPNSPLNHQAFSNEDIDRNSQVNERTLSSSQSLHALAGELGGGSSGNRGSINNNEEDEISHVTRVHGMSSIAASPFPSPSHTQAIPTTPTPSLQFKEQTFDLRIDLGKIGRVGSCDDTRSTTPTSSVFDEHKEGT